LSGSAQKITLSKGQSVFIPGPKSRVTLGGTGSGFAASASS
jgi:mannose-6-phosphate isomerase class I